MTSAEYMEMGDKLLKLSKRGVSGGMAAQEWYVQMYYEQVERIPREIYFRLRTDNAPLRAELAERLKRAEEQLAKKVHAFQLKKYLCEGEHAEIKAAEMATLDGAIYAIKEVLEII